MKLRQTHSLATLPISKEAYMEIANKLLAAGHGQSFLIRGRWENLQEEIKAGRATIDMHGIGLVLEQEEEFHCAICDRVIGGRGVCQDCAVTPIEPELSVKEQLAKRDKNYYITETEEVDF